MKYYVQQYLFLPLACLSLLLSSSIASADETYACLYNGNERTIRVAYTYPDSKVPCEVIYEKGSGSQVLWNAQSEEGYCEAQALNFVEKQRGWGWDCAKLEAAIETTETPLETTTEVTPTVQ